MIKDKNAVVFKADEWNNNVKSGKGWSDNCSVADSRQTQCRKEKWYRPQTHEMGDMDDESIHAVFKTFHSFRDGKISSITVQRKKETKMKHEMPAL